MTFAGHGFLAAGLTAIVVKELGGPPAVPAATAWVLGTLPDSLDWAIGVARKFPLWAGRRITFGEFIKPVFGKVYGWFHHKCPLWLAVVVYPIGLHLLFDEEIHRYPGYNWWPEYWDREVFHWVVGLGLLGAAFFL